MAKGYTPDTRTRIQRATRFFARPESFTLECPRCGSVYQIRLKKGLSTTDPNWDPMTARFSCTARNCARVYVIGLVAWPVAQSGAKATPEDQVPSPRQLAALRREGGGWWLADEAKLTDPRPGTTNITLEDHRPDSAYEDPELDLDDQPTDETEKEP